MILGLVDGAPHPVALNPMKITSVKFSLHLLYNRASLDSIRVGILDGAPQFMDFVIGLLYQRLTHGANRKARRF